MKKTHRKLLSLLLACLMVCLPLAQASAAVQYEASAGVDVVLFPGDSIINVGLPVTMTGTDGSVSEVTLEAGTWTNNEEGRVFLAKTADDGSSVGLTEAGYVLVVENGKSAKEDKEPGKGGNHYEFPAEETPEILQDIAYYQKDETVKLKASDPAEGMVFAGWTADSEGVVFADAASPETTMTMLDKKVTVTANYQEAPQDPDTGEGDMPQDPDTGEGDMPQDSGTGEGDVPQDSGTGEGDVPQDSGTGEGSSGTDGDIITIDPPADGGEGDGSGETPVPVLYEVTVNNGSGAGSYQAGDWVTITANDRSAEGLAFNGWFAESMNVTLDDLSAAETGFVMPEAAVTVSAQYQEQQAPEGDEGDGSGEIIIGGEDTVGGNENPGGDGTQGTGGSGDDSTVQNPVVYRVTYDQNNVEVVSPSTPEEFVEGAAVTVRAADRTAENLQFDRWTAVVTDTAGAPVEKEIDFTDNGDGTYTFLMPAGNVALTANYSEIPKASYTVTGNAASVDGGNTTYTVGDTVAVTADAPAAGYRFSGWSAFKTDTGEAVTISFVNANDDGSKATFAMPDYHVTVKAEYTQILYTVSVTNGAFGDGTASASFAAGSPVTVTANAAAAGTAFSKWSGTVTATGEVITFDNAAAATATFTMPAGDVTVMAEYQNVTPTYRVTVANGTINGQAAEMTVDEGTQLTITANPNPAGQAFAGWKITDASNNTVDPAALGINAYSSSVTVTIGQALNFQAQYEGIQYGIKVKKGYADYESAVSGTKVTITAEEAPEGKEFDYWEVQSGNISLKNAYSEVTKFDMPGADVVVKAHYKDAEYLLDVENGYSDNEYYDMDEKATISSDYPVSGKVFDKWVAVSGNVEFADASRWRTTLTMPGSDVTVKATYKDGPSVNNNVILDLVAGGQYYTGDTIKFTASGAGMDNTNPNPGDYRYRPAGYQIGNVTNNWNGSPYTTSMAIKAAGEYTLKVTFNRQVFDGDEWVSDGTTDTKSVTFRVVTKAAGVATGDDTPLLVVATIAGVSCVLFIILLVVFIRRKRRR